MAVVKEKEKTAVPGRSSRKRPAPAGKPVSASAEKPGKRSNAKEAKAALPSRSRIGKPALGKGKILEKARVPENGPERDKALAERIARCMLDKKGLNVTGLDLREVPGASFDFFVICGASSGPQARAIADEISDKVYLDFREDPLHEEGYGNGEWILLDYGNILAHVFLDSTREHFRIEELWGDAGIKVYADEAL